jgi:hypothetical protein
VLPYLPEWLPGILHFLWQHFLKPIKCCFSSFKQGAKKQVFETQETQKKLKIPEEEK